MTQYPFNVRATAQALHILAEFAHVGVGEARELARVLNNFADAAEAETPAVTTGNFWLDKAEQEAK